VRELRQDLLVDLALQLQLALHLALEELTLPDRRRPPHLANAHGLGPGLNVRQGRARLLRQLPERAALRQHKGLRVAEWPFARALLLSHVHLSFC